MTARLNKKSTSVVLGMSAVIAAGLTGCDASALGADVGKDYAQVCVDKATQKRLEDQKCKEDGGGSHAHGWTYIPLYRGAASQVPPVGSALTQKGALTTLPKDRSATTVPSAGGDFRSVKSANGKYGTVRGGFGYKGGGSGS